MQFKASPAARPTPRRPFYGWIMLPLATIAFMATAPGQTFGISAFNAPLRESLGLSHSQLAGAYMLGTLLASLPLTWFGVMIDRIGQRRSLAIIALLFGATLIASSQVRGFLTLFACFLLLRMLGPGALSLASNSTLPFWFQRRLGTVEGLRQFGMAGAIAVTPSLNAWLIAAFGWRQAWLILGLGFWLVMLPVLLLYRNRPSDVGQRIEPAGRPRRGATASPATSYTLAQVRRTRAFWIVAAVLAAWTMFSTAVLFSIVPLLAAKGMGLAEATRVFTGYAIVLAVVQLAGGWLSDRVPLHYLLSLGTISMAAVMALLLLIPDATLLWPLAIGLGMAHGLLTSVSSPLWPRYYGTAHIGRIRGLLATVMVGSSSVGPFLMGLCMDWTGSYDAVLLLSTIMLLALSVLGLLATPPVGDPESARQPAGDWLPEPTG